MALGRLVLRVAVGGLMAGHGLQKLNGSFGGPGPEGTRQMMSAIGMHPADQQAKAAALTETVGGALTATGLLSPLGPAMIMGGMAVAIKKVHLRNGVWVTQQGYEYNAVLIAACLALADWGPGPVSLDGLLGKERSGTGWAVLAAGLAAAAAAGALAVAERSAPAAAGPAEASEAVGTVATPPPADGAAGDRTGSVVLD